ncbi:hypothetical protein CVT26_012891 [Gymnopilus dilepis]|uniref:Uncharacterized protein n=1 Tax=Gymnopilus dilepis TaxID=231916 RepID=A0A409WVE0_9AGAR|nr:hypothetical protein CVT26_012891 [Gymnopilus dilepis]
MGYQMGAHYLWALRKSLKRLVSHMSIKHIPLSLVPGVPRVNILESGLEVTDIITPGQTYKVKVNSTFTAVEGVKQDEDCILEVIYPRKLEEYWEEIHHAVGLAGFAPRLIGELPSSLEASIIEEHGIKIKAMKAAARYFLVELLRSPSMSQAGWIDLADLAANFLILAWSEKHQILEALLKLAGWLDSHGFAFYALQADGIFVKMSLLPEPNLDENLCIKVIDFKEQRADAGPWVKRPGLRWTKKSQGQTDNEKAVRNFFDRWLNPRPAETEIPPFSFDSEDE